MGQVLPFVSLSGLHLTRVRSDVESSVFGSSV